MKKNHLLERPSRWRYYGGWICFILSFCLPLFSPLLALLGLSQTVTTILAGSLIIGGPEIMMIFAIALWGKQTFDYFMGQLGQLLKSFIPANQVSTRRYYIGLSLFLASFLPSWILAYAPSLLDDSARIAIVLTADVVFVISFFILGGNFWEKIRRLFIAD